MLRFVVIRRGFVIVRRLVVCPRFLFGTIIPVIISVLLSFFILVFFISVSIIVAVIAVVPVIATVVPPVPVFFLFRGSGGLVRSRRVVGFWALSAFTLGLFVLVFSLSLGLVPFDVVTAPKAKTAYAIGTESVSLSGLADLLGVDILWRKNPAEDNGQIVFPSDCALILNIADMDLAKVKADSFLTYCTLSLEGTLTDQEIYRLYMMSKAENLFPLAFDDFIYPARNYALFYPVIHSISALGIVLSLIVLCCAVLSQAIVDYLREKDDLGETALLRLFGLDRLGYVLMKTSSSLLPILSGSLLALILYTLFMAVFKAAKGFTFFFAPLLYFAYFLPSVLLGLLSALYAFLLYRKTDGRAYSILEGNEKKE